MPGTGQGASKYIKGDGWHHCRADACYLWKTCGDQDSFSAVRNTQKLCPCAKTTSTIQESSRSSAHLCPSPVTEPELLEVISSCMKNKKVTENSQHTFPLAMLCLTNLINFSDEMTSSMDKGQQWILLTLTLGRLLTKFTLWDPCSKSGEVSARGVDDKLGKKLPVPSCSK